MRKLMRYALVCVCIVVCSLSCSMRFYDYKSDIAHQKIIIDAYFKYRQEKGHRPSSIENLVKEGYLPDEAYFYSATVESSLVPKKISYSSSDYKIFKPQSPGSHKIIGVKADGDGTSWRFCGDAIEYAETKDRSH